MKPKFSLTLDDFSPHIKAGLNFESIEWCDRLIEKYPEIKINLFTPAAYCRLGENPCFLTESIGWVNRVKKMPKNYRINLHGYYHRRLSKKHGNSNNDEWQYLNYKQAKTIGSHMIQEFKNAGLDFEPTFRPPGWKISASACKALEDLGIKCFAGSKEYFNRVKGDIKVKWVSYNWDLVDKTNLEGDITAYGHTSSWTNNYMDKKRFELIDEVLSSKDFEFKFIEDMGT